MKKIIIGILILSMVLLAGCQSNDERCAYILRDSETHESILYGVKTNVQYPDGLINVSKICCCTMNFRDTMVCDCDRE